MEQEIELEQENIIVSSGGGAVNSVNGYTGDVVLTTSDLENTSDYQTGNEVDAAIADAVAGKQDTLTAGANITISNNVISATDTKYTAGNGINISDQNAISADTTVLATKQDVTNEATARENADIGLQGQIDAITASSDVKDIVGTYADLQNYDTSTLGNNDIIKVLQDETQDDETTYYRWSTTTQTFTLIGEEGPYYTKSATDALLADKQDKLTAGANIAIDSNNEISATNTTYSAGTGLDLTGTTFSVDTTTIQPKLTAGSNITIDGNNEISATDTTYSDFVGTDGTAAGTAGLVPAPATTDAGKFLKADGTWDTAGGGGGPTVVQTTGTSTTDVMSQNATTSMVFADPSAMTKIKIGANTSANIGTRAIEIGEQSSAIGNYSVALGYDSTVSSGANYGVSIGGGSVSKVSGIAIRGGAHGNNAISIGNNTYVDGENSIGLGVGATTSTKGVMSIETTNYSPTGGYNNSQYRLLTGVYDGQSAHDAATYGQLLSYSAINGAGAPTTATEGKYVGQLYYDTTNEAMYFLKTIDTTTTPATYTWEALGGGGGGGVTVVQTTGTSTTNVMSQNATTSMVFADPATAQKVSIGATQNNGSYAVAVGYQSQIVSGNRGVALGYRAEASANGAVAIGTGANAANVGEVNIGSSSTAYGYNNSNYRLLSGLYDGQSAHDAATKGQLDSRVIGSLTSAPTTSTVGVVGSLLATVESGTGHLYICTDDTGGSYTWQTLV